MNDELINSAVAFLKDPNVASSPLTKKVEFLETKGLNQQEIEEALKRANGQSTAASPPSSSPSNTYSSYSDAAPAPPAPLDYYGVPPQVPERSWKDYFIMATATAGVGYGLYQVVSRYLVPNIVPPAQLRIDEDKEKIDEEFIKIDKVLEQMAIEQKEIKDANEGKLKEVDVVIENVNDFMAKYNKDILKFDDDLRLMKLEIDNLRNSIDKNMKLTKENIHDELTEISEELVSLKNLIKARSETSSSETSRKVASVSSIPSASEILKKAKAKNISASPPASNSPVLPQQEIKPAEPKESEAKGAVYAAGIPDWQLKHKQQEEAKEQENSGAPGIPAWQQAGNDDEIVEKSIENVGVPAWQLNASK